MRRIITCALVCATPLVALNAQQPVGPSGAQIAPATSIMQVTPLGLLQFGPTFEYHAAVGPQATIGGGIRIVSLGLLSHLKASADNDALGMASWTVAATTLFYASPGLQGHFFGPRVEWGKINTRYGHSTLFAVVGEYGHRWRRASGFTYSVGAQAGMASDDFKGNIPSDDNIEKIAFAALVLTVGRAR